MLEIKEVNNCKVGSIAGTDRLNATIAPEIKQDLTNLLKVKGSHVVLDLKNIKFIDSTGIGTLISALKTSRENNCSFKICSVQKEVMSLLCLMKLDQVFDILPDMECCN